jgi:signal transduction histidine kinase
MVALDVAGQIRERSPADLAIFGESATRLLERFVQPGTGQELLARAASDGSAETSAWLSTGAGQQYFRISLWRQRGGDRIRVMAAFAPCAASADAGSEDPAGETAESARAALIQMGNDMRLPLAAVLGFAELIRAKPETLDPTVAARHAADIVAAAWRLMRIADDLEAAGTSGATWPGLHLGEVDITRLARRVSRLAEPAARASGVRVDTGGLPERGLGCLVLGDESSLWSIIDNLLHNAIRHGGRGAVVAIGLRSEGDNQVLTVADDGPGLAADHLARLLRGAKRGCGLAFLAEMTRANGADLEIDTALGQGLRARIVFSASRCVVPV